jgi:hypothetical protein
MRIKMNWPIAIVIITFAILILGGWLSLVLSKTITIESGYELASHAAAYVAGAFTPLILYWKEKRITFDVDSDPPKAMRAGDKTPRSS